MKYATHAAMHNRIILPFLVVQGGISSTTPQTHFGRNAVESTWQAVAPRLSSSLPTEAAQRLTAQLRALSDQLDRLAQSAGTGAAAVIHAVQAVRDHWLGVPAS